MKAPRLHPRSKKVDMMAGMERQERILVIDFGSQAFDIGPGAWDVQEPRVFSGFRFRA